MLKKRSVLGIIAAAVLIVTAVYASWFREDDSLSGSGTVEARNIRVGSKVGGRVSEVFVREGDEVEAGQILVAFEDEELKAVLEGSKANLEKMERGFRPEEIAEARAAAMQAKAELDQRRNGYRREEIAAAEAELERAKADEIRAQLDFQRYDKLMQDDAVTRQEHDTAEANWKMAAARRKSAQHRLEELKRGYRPEEIAAAESRYLQAQATLEKMLNGNRPEDIALARAQYAVDQSRLRETRIESPAAATVEVLDLRPGDLVAPNTPFATLLERDQIYVRIYVPETKIGHVKLGQKGDVRVDSFPSQTFEGVVEQINQQAEFLPRNVQTREERVHQVFGVKLRIHDPSRRIRPGMAADVRLMEAAQ